MLVPAFPNAIYWSNALHWNWAIRPNEREKASFLTENIIPIQENGRLKFVEVPVNDKTNFEGPLPTVSFTDNISIRFVNGHTESMMLPQICYKGRTVVYMADLLPSAAHIPLPYVMAYDMFPLTTLKEKRSFLSEAVAGDYLLFFEHDPLIECCSLQVTEKGIRQNQLFQLNEL